MSIENSYQDPGEEPNNFQEQPLDMTQFSIRTDHAIDPLSGLRVGTKENRKHWGKYYGEYNPENNRG